MGPTVGIKRKNMLLSMSLMNISSLHKKILMHVSLLIGGEVAVHSFLDYISLYVTFSQFLVSYT